MINKEIQDYINYLLFLKYDRQLVWSNTTSVRSFYLLPGHEVKLPFMI